MDLLHHIQIYAAIGMDSFSLEFLSFRVSKGWVELTVAPLCKVGIHYQVVITQWLARQLATGVVPGSNPAREIIYKQ